jgi:hypothetical protein
VLLTEKPPTGTIYLTSMASTASKARLEKALDLLLSSSSDQVTPISLYHLYYEQAVTARALKREMAGPVPISSFPSLSLGLALCDEDLAAVMEAWKIVLGNGTQENEYMIFEDREGADAHDDEVYE